MVEPEVFRKQIEESKCDIVGTFWRPGNCASLVPPVVTPLVGTTDAASECSSRSLTMFYEV